jgi:hypothetical protein
LTLLQTLWNGVDQVPKLLHLIWSQLIHLDSEPLRSGALFPGLNDLMPPRVKVSLLCLDLPLSILDQMKIKQPAFRSLFLAIGPLSCFSAPLSSFPSLKCGFRGKWTCSGKS